MNNNREESRRERNCRQVLNKYEDVEDKREELEEYEEEEVLMYC